MAGTAADETAWRIGTFVVSLWCGRTSVDLNVGWLIYIIRAGTVVKHDFTHLHEESRQAGGEFT